MSEPMFSVKVLRNVLIAMRDGVKLSANITRPDADGRFPAIMEYFPYHKSASTEPGQRYRYFAERGYVLIQYDVRGTGDSEGFTTDVYQPDEIRDGCEMVEWTAAQPWCTGDVGMWGISYPGVVCWQVAMHAPPHLKAIIVRSGTDDPYVEWTNPGGSPRPYIYENYAPLMTAYNLAPPNMELCGERWAEIWKEHLERNVPWGIGFVQNHLDGPYWRSRSVRPDYDRVKCPAFVIGGWADWYPTPLLRAFANLNVPKKAMVGPWSHWWPDDAMPGPRINGMREYEKWFDQWLKGIDTGVVNEPPVTVFVRKHHPPSTIRLMDNGFWRHETEWPPAHAKLTPMYLREDGGLNAVLGGAGRDENVYDPTVGWTSGRHGGGAHPPWGMQIDQRVDEALSLTYTTPLLTEDVEVTGNPQAVLHFSSTADIAGCSVKLSDVAPDGSSVMVTRGYLNTAHRDSSVNPSPIEPGRVYELRINMLSVAYLFEKGHSIRVTVAGADFPNVWPTPKACVNTIHRGAATPSHVLLPIVRERSPKLPEPDLQPSPNPLPSRESVAKIENTITHDITNETTTIAYTTRVGSGINTSSYTVSKRNPAQAVVKATYEDTVSYPGMVFKTRVQTVTRSDENAFHHVVEARVDVNDHPHYEKSWAVSAPRRGC